MRLIVECIFMATLFGLLLLSGNVPEKCGEYKNGRWIATPACAATKENNKIILKSKE